MNVQPDLFDRVPDAAPDEPPAEPEAPKERKMRMRFIPLDDPRRPRNRKVKH